jgi:DNA-binding MarR family transcriptional regulator
MKVASNRARTLPRATYLIKELERAVRVRIDAIVRPLGLTAVQYTALSVLARHSGMSSAELARRSFVSPQAANELVSAFEEQGFIRRKVDRQGGRALGIYLTPRGERSLLACDERVDALEAELFRGVDRRGEAQFREMLRACRNAIHESREPGKAQLAKRAG